MPTKAIAICICLIVAILVQPAFALGYDAQKEEQYITKADNLLSSRILSNEWMSVYLLYATYEATKEQNQLIAEQTHAIWVSNCYVSHSVVFSYSIPLTGNLSALEKECIAAGYPTIILTGKK